MRFNGILMLAISAFGCIVSRPLKAQPAIRSVNCDVGSMIRQWHYGNREFFFGFRVTWIRSTQRNVCRLAESGIWHFVHGRRIGVQDAGYSGGSKALPNSIVRVRTTLPVEGRA